MKNLSDEERYLLLLLAERNSGIKHFSKQNPDQEVWGETTDDKSLLKANEGICYICNQLHDFHGKTFDEKYESVIDHALDHIKKSKLKLFT